MVGGGRAYHRVESLQPVPRLTLLAAAAAQGKTHTAVSVRRSRCTGKRESRTHAPTRARTRARTRTHTQRHRQRQRQRHTNRHRDRERQIQTKDTDNKTALSSSWNTHRAKRQRQSIVRQIHIFSLSLSPIVLYRHLFYPSPSLPLSILRQIQLKDTRTRTHTHTPQYTQGLCRQGPHMRERARPLAVRI